MHSPIPKGQHFVSKLLLKRFVNDTGRLFFFSKQFPDKGVLATTPEKLFRGTHIYSTRDKNGVPDVRLERYYSAMENLAAPIVDKIVTRARAGDTPHLTETERKIWDRFFCDQWKRVPDFHGKILDAEDLVPNVRARVAAKRPEAPGFTPEMELLLQNPESRQRILRNAMISSLASHSTAILDVLARKGLGVSVIRNPAKSFAIGSFPVVKLNLPGRASLSDPTVEAWLPVAHDVAVSPAPILPDEEGLYFIPDHLIRWLNTSTFKQSTAIAGKSEHLIESLAHQR
jgi:hypothetical protein